jgi:hypothetical protein
MGTTGSVALAVVYSGNIVYNGLVIAQRIRASEAMRQPQTFTAGHEFYGFFFIGHSPSTASG